MCCFVLVLGFLGPRFAFLWVWLATTRVELAFSGNFWLLVGLAFLLDLASYFGRNAQSRYQGEPA